MVGPGIASCGPKNNGRFKRPSGAYDDEGKFVDLEQSQLWYGEELCVISE